jgi:hypothetical protein
VLSLRGYLETGSDDVVVRASDMRREFAPGLERRS